jgi:hypothetical protein
MTAAHRDWALGAVLMLAVMEHAVARPGCLHDKMALRKADYVPQARLRDRRSQGYEPIRIELDFGLIDADMAADQSNYIKKLLTDARAWLQMSLFVKRLSSNLVLKDTRKADATYNWCGDVPDLLQGREKYVSPGVSADLVIFVLSQSNNKNCKDGLTLAYASHCQQDPADDRPIAGYIQVSEKGFSEQRK